MLTDFTTFFRALWDRDPFPWQTMLAECVATGRWPDVIDLPTAAGKTACLDIAVYALAAQADKPLGERTSARRIWFVVDRRIVVDEAFERARTMADKLANDPAPAIRPVVKRLLILLDEAHCAVPFLQTLHAVQEFRKPKWSEVENPTPFQITILSATPPGEANEKPLEIFPTEAERERALNHEALQVRLRASKKAVLEKVRDEETLAERIANAAAAFARDGKSRIGIIVNRVGRASEVAKKLREEARKEIPSEPAAFDVEILTADSLLTESDAIYGDPKQPEHLVLIKGGGKSRLLRSGEVCLFLTIGTPCGVQRTEV